MVFKPEDVPKFLDLFSSVRAKIANFEGCESVILLQDIKDTNQFFTYSLWHSEKYLEQYRHSQLFREVWGKTKKLFLTKAEAWSVETVENV